LTIRFLAAWVGRGAHGGASTGALHRLRAASPPLPVYVAAALLLSLSLMWAAMTPVTRAPDEVQHLNSVVRIAAGGGWPKPGDARLKTGLIDMRELAGTTVEGRLAFLPGSVNRTPEAPLFTWIPPTGVEERKSLQELDDGTLSPAYDQMTQHPPGYYGLTASAYVVAGAEDWRYDRAIYFLRALTALTIAATVPISCYVVTRELTGHDGLAQAASFLPLLIPQLGFIGGTVTNDGVAIAVAALLATAVIKLTGSGPSRHRLVVLALVVAAAFWTKGTALTLIPAVPVAIAIAHRRAQTTKLSPWSHGFLRDTVLVLGSAFLLGGWWWAVNLIRYGTLQPAGHPTPIGTVPRLSVTEFFEVFQSRMSVSYFGDIGFLEAPMPDALTRPLTIVFVVLTLMGLISRRRLGDRLVMALSMTLAVGGTFFATYSSHLATNNLAGLQGRYLFIVLVPTLALVAAGLWLVIGWLHPSSSTVIAMVAATGSAISFLGLLLGFQTYYLESGRSVGLALDRLLGWSPWPWRPLAGLAVMALGFLVVLAYSLGRGDGVASGQQMSEWPESADPCGDGGAPSPDFRSS
jgi:4-amino-4-deoxy-L-arabinose transferase-like glycosyltransferase